eukprot:tig00001214_g7559.t1
MCKSSTIAISKTVNRDATSWGFDNTVTATSATPTTAAAPAVEHEAHQADVGAAGSAAAAKLADLFNLTGSEIDSAEKHANKYTDDAIAGLDRKVDTTINNTKQELNTYINNVDTGAKAGIAKNAGDIEQARADLKADVQNARETAQSYTDTTASALRGDIEGAKAAAQAAANAAEASAKGHADAVSDKLHTAVTGEIGVAKGEANKYTDEQIGALRTATVKDIADAEDRSKGFATEKDTVLRGEVTSEWQKGVSDASAALNDKLGEVESAAKAADAINAANIVATESALSAKIAETGAAATAYTDTTASALRGDIEGAKAAAQAAANAAEASAKGHADAVSDKLHTAVTGEIGVAKGEANKYTDEQIGALRTATVKDIADAEDRSKGFATEKDAALHETVTGEWQNAVVNATKALSTDIATVDAAAKDADKLIDGKITAVELGLRGEITAAKADAITFADTASKAVGEKAASDLAETSATLGGQIDAAKNAATAYTDTTANNLSNTFAGALTAAREELGKNIADAEDRSKGFATEKDAALRGEVTSEWQKGVSDASAALNDKLGEVESAAKAADAINAANIVATESALSAKIAETGAAATAYTDTTASALRGDIEGAKAAAQAAANAAEASAKGHADAVSDKLHTAVTGEIGVAKGEANKYTDEQIGALRTATVKDIADAEDRSKGFATDKVNDVEKAITSAWQGALGEAKNDLSVRIENNFNESKAYSDGVATAAAGNLAAAKGELVASIDDTLKKAMKYTDEEIDKLDSKLTTNLIEATKALSADIAAARAYAEQQAAEAAKGAVATAKEYSDYREVEILKAIGAAKNDAVQSFHEYVDWTKADNLTLMKTYTDSQVAEVLARLTALENSCAAVCSAGADATKIKSNNGNAYAYGQQEGFTNNAGGAPNSNSTATTAATTEAAAAATTTTTAAAASSSSAASAKTSAKASKGSLMLDEEEGQSVLESFMEGAVAVEEAAYGEEAHADIADIAGDCSDELDLAFL